MCTQITCDFSVTNTVATLYEHCVSGLIHVLACSSSSCLRGLCLLCVFPGYTRCSCHPRILSFLLNISFCFLQQTTELSQRAGTVSLPATEIFNKYCQMSVQVISTVFTTPRGIISPRFLEMTKMRKERNPKQNRLFNQPKVTGFISGSMSIWLPPPTCELDLSFDHEATAVSPTN